VLSRIKKSILRRALGTITHVSTQDSVVALTFDDGPHPIFTPELLEILKNHKAKATFFMIGKNAQRYPELVSDVAMAGHAIGNHTWDHSSLPLLTGRQRRAQIRACEKAIAPYGKRIFRPPYGHQSIASRLDAFWLGYQVITWNVMAHDWLDHDANRLLDGLKNKIRPGCMVVFHDDLYAVREKHYANRQPTLKAVHMFLERFSDQYSFITVPELIRRGYPHRQNWYWEPDQEWISTLKMVEYNDLG